MSAPQRLLALSVLLAIASPVRADIGVIVAQPVSALGVFTRVGHVGTYLSNICPDGSPIRMRVCLPGESGGAVTRPATLSENEDYDWAIVPFEEYLHGFASPDLAPLIGTRKLQRAIEGHDFNAVFSRAMTTTDGAAPEGQWKAALATRFDRSMFVFSVETTAADDATIIVEFNTAPNRSRFNFFYQIGDWPSVTNYNSLSRGWPPTGGGLENCSGSSRPMKSSTLIEEAPGSDCR